MLVKEVDIRYCQYFPEEFASFLIEQNSNFYNLIINFHFNKELEKVFKKINNSDFESFKKFINKNIEKFIIEPMTGYLIIINFQDAFEAYQILSDNMHEYQFFLEKEFN